MQDLVFSGVQPTSTPHIGNYIGALKQWVEISTQHRSLFCIVDDHAITVPQDPKALRASTLQVAAIYAAVGIDLTRSHIFIQSEVVEHSELGWILSTLVKMSELERMTQFKDKAKAKGENVGAGLFTYPALMAADILLYDTSIVPVGDDQMQHVELTRLLGRRFNSQFGETFVIPQAMIQKTGARIMSLQDAEKKMSKSDPSTASTVFLTDDADTIRKKFSRAVTDSDASIAYDAEKRPAVANLMTIYHHMTGKNMKQITQEFEGKGYGDFKKTLAEAVIAHLSPIQEKYREYMDDKVELGRILDEGRDFAKEKAVEKMKIVRERVGLGR